MLAADKWPLAKLKSKLVHVAPPKEKLVANVKGVGKGSGRKGGRRGSKAAACGLPKFPRVTDSTFVYFFYENKVCMHASWDGMWCSGEGRGIGSCADF